MTIEELYQIVLELSERFRRHSHDNIETDKLDAIDLSTSDVTGVLPVANTIRLIMLKIIDDITTLTTGDGKLTFCIPSELNNFNLTNAQAFVSTVSSSGTPTVQIANVTDSVDMLSTKITIDANEKTSYTAATPSVIDTTKDDVVTGDILRIDVDVAGTGAKGLGVILTFTPQ